MQEEEGGEKEKEKKKKEKKRRKRSLQYCMRMTAQVPYNKHSLLYRTFPETL